MAEQLTPTQLLEVLRADRRADTYFATKNPDRAQPLLRDFVAGHRQRLSSDDLTFAVS